VFLLIIAYRIGPGLAAERAAVPVNSAGRGQA
jgi:hypothetical protein